MSYLAWWNPLSWLSEGLEAIAGAVFNALRTLFYVIDSLLYQLIIYLYKAFELLCRSRLLDSEIIQEISRRVGLLLGVIMLFIVVSQFIKMLVDPELMTDNKKGAASIIKKCLIVIVMLGSSQFIFLTLYRVQNEIITENIISKIILPYNVDTENFGNLLSEEVFTAFYGVDPQLANDESNEVMGCKSAVNRLKYNIYNHANFQSGYFCLNQSAKIEKVVENGQTVMEEQEIHVINYNFLLATAAGIALVYFIFSYCISIGVRTVQLAVLEVIAPMAIISYLSPKDDNMFSKWGKIYISTYIDVFIRIGIINFVAFLIATLLENEDKWFFWESIGGKPSDPFLVAFLMVAMVIALLTFAKKAPELLKNLFPSTGASGLGFGLTSPKNLLGAMAGSAIIGNVAKRGYGAAAVGFGGWQKNVRKAIGNAAADPNKKNFARVGGALLFGGLGGVRRGLMTTNAAGRKQAVNNAYNAYQSKNKMRDLGYGASAVSLAKVVKGDTSGWKALGNKAKDKLRAAGLQDQYIEDLADMKDLSIESKQKALYDLQESYGKNGGTQTASQSKSSKGNYILDTANGPFMGTLVKDANGNIVETNGRYQLSDSNGRVEFVDKDAIRIADMTAEIGKATGDSKKLHQKAEEQKQGNK